VSLPGFASDGACLRRFLAGRGFASGGSSPEGQVSGMAWGLASSVLWQGSVCLPSRRPPSGLSHRVKGPTFGDVALARISLGPLTRRDRATPGRRDGRQHSGGLWGLRPPGAFRAVKGAFAACPHALKGTFGAFNVLKGTFRALGGRAVLAAFRFLLDHGVDLYPGRVFACTVVAGGAASDSAV
jgi:hypothetical protein